ncbi:MAG: hydroxyacylglutathione hydrolase [Lysobacteraceae bacterium]|nr:MAG: hydroxyacylglutathione hydrolase [Xanthomonadaceae bacterium]
MQIHQFPCLGDNYGFLLHDPDTGQTATIDTPDAKVINAELDRLGWTLSQILNTHHHPDHAGGNVALKQRWGCRIVGPAADRDRIPGIDVAVAEGDLVAVGNIQLEVFDTPGHTRGHIVYKVVNEPVAFVGDTVFAMGCGRLFEGTPEQMWPSLQKILAWPGDTRLYCAHEYTLANAQFALTVDPDNAALRQRYLDVQAARQRDQPTVPTTLAIERKTNPFLRPDDPKIRATIGKPDATDVEAFAEIRRRKDRF